MEQKKLAEPKCPSCSAVGLNCIVSQDSVQQHGSGDAWFQVAHCAECGHVYGVFAKITNPITPKFPSFPGR
ncbi:Uncharacterised protein [Pseudomonas putida]|jgi:uncharacterized Zn finger protein|nr:transcriptional regulator [Pseudomonas sp. SMT-1]QDW57264.1 transcriptional regulator [Pseudomonas sp. KBS0802]UZA73484.1 transcriptional regulator [Pseudomonas putida]SKC06407.1 hypothetical protein SAMN05216307_2685 [Pseudomonas putida]SMQ00375.1 hypothetical protein SAMN05216380_1171 [Pseudomonas putida]